MARKANKAQRPEVTLTLRSEGHMAKKKGGKKKGGTRRSGRKGGSHKRKGTRRRRNPGSGGFLSRAGHLAGGALVALATGVLVTVATGKASAGGNLALYGIPAGTFVAGAALSKMAPTIGTGVALGAFAPFALPVASHILAGDTPTASLSPVMAKTAAGLGRAAREMRAVTMGRRGMSAVDISAVNLGDAYDEEMEEDYD